MYKITEESIKMLLWDIRIRQLLLYYWDTCKFFFFNCQEWHPSPKLRLKLSSPQKRWKQYDIRTVIPFPCCQHLATFALSISICVGLSVLFLSADFKVNRRYQDISHLMLPENEAWSRTSTAPLTPFTMPSPLKSVRLPPSPCILKWPLLLLVAAVKPQSQ